MQLAAAGWSVIAVDSSAKRLARLEENLDRTGLNAAVVQGDIRKWEPGDAADAVLLDAPCSATGIIRRHPDIKVLRSAADIAKLAQLQGKLLDSLWPLLKPDGVLLYATCSIMPDENTRVVEAFLTRQPEAVCELLDAPWGITQNCGRQLLPATGGHDGFYYARLRKPA